MLLPIAYIHFVIVCKESIKLKEVVYHNIAELVVLVELKVPLLLYPLYSEEENGQSCAHFLVSCLPEHMLEFPDNLHKHMKENCLHSCSETEHCQGQSRLETSTWDAFPAMLTHG